MIIIWRKLIMAKLFLGKVKVDDQVTEFDMSGLTAGKLTLPTGAIKNLSELDAGVLLGTTNMPQAGGGKLIQEKHLVDSIDFAEQGRMAIQSDVDANEAAALAGRMAHLAGRMPPKNYAVASTPMKGKAWFQSQNS